MKPTNVRRPRTASSSSSPETRVLSWACAGALAAVSAASPIGCVNFDREEQIADTRVLAVKNAPAEILFSPLFLSPPDQRPPFPLPSTAVDVEVWAFDPRGGTVTTSVNMCPDDAGDSSCRLYDKDQDEDFARLVEPARSEVAALLAPVQLTGTVDEEIDALGRVLPATFRYVITPSAIDFFQPKDVNGNNTPSIFPLLPRFTIVVENETAKAKGEAVFAERAFKRLPLALNLADPTLPKSFLDDLGAAIGVTLCDGPLPDDDTFVEGRAPCLHPRGANANPPLTGFRLESALVADELTQGMLEGEPDLGRQSTLRADVGGQIALTPMWEAGAAERYQVLSFEIETSKIVVENRVEDMACEWYVTRGTIAAAQTALQFNDDRLGTVWTLPADAAAGERDSLVLVVLDQRGGTEVATVTVEYR